jgi:hypothetical protein
MPYAQTPWVQRGQLITETGQQIFVDSPAWFDWLQTATRFCYSPDHTPYRLTVRKEKRRHRSYWFGYLKHNRKLHNIYLGKTERLTKSFLDQACDRLVQKAGQVTM